MLNLEILVVLCSMGNVLTIASEQCDTYQFSHPYNLGESCKELYDWNTQTHNRSGYYWLINPPRHVYCDMGQRSECGNIGGWTRIANVNITRGDECPTGWNKSSHDGISFCRSPSDNAGCYPILFSSKGISYQKVCGLARGYQKGTPDGFAGVNFDGLSITYGSSNQHIWAYGVGYTEGYTQSHINCPCAAVSRSSPNSFIGQNYYCESGAKAPTTDYLTADPLWDGADCPTGNTCCDNPNLPWFYRELDMTTMDDIEVSICTDEPFSNEGILVENLELYIL